MTIEFENSGCPGSVCRGNVKAGLKVLLIEDEPELTAAVAYNLERAGYQVRAGATGAGGLDLLEREPDIALAVVDIMLPDISGIEICRRLRGRPETAHLPILFLTARGTEFDKVLGFESGADDYVVKPFSMRELVLRVTALLQRSQRVDEQPNEIRFGVLRVDSAAHRVWVENEEVSLTALEFRLLTTLVGRPGRVQTRDTLLSDVWGIDAEITTRTVDTHVGRLREKLRAAGAYIETLRGVGYRFLNTPNESTR